MSATLQGTRNGIEAAWAPGALAGADGVAESVAAKDLTNLYRTSCYFRDKERYRAFCAMYAVMRVVDDRVDNLLAQPHLTSSDRTQAVAVVKAWHRAVRVCLTGRQPESGDLATCDHPHVDELLGAFSHAVERFPVPAKLWDDFFAAMLDDLKRDRFATYGKFLEYAEGAAVAPTTIYLHLITAELRENEHVYEVAREFDIMRCGRSLGRFAYLAHVLRDLREDLMTGEQGLLYLAEDDMAAHGVTVESLRRDAADETACPRLRALVRELVERASKLAREGCTCLSTLDGRLSADRGFVLELIVGIYEGVLGKIVSCSHDVMAERHRLTTAEKGRIALEIASAQRVALGRLGVG
jgi:phytoene synthase